MQTYFIACCMFIRLWAIRFQSEKYRLQRGDIVN